MPGSNILVLGAGELGREVIRSLVHHTSSSPVESSRPTISVLLRRPNQEIESWGVNVILADLAKDSAEELALKFGKFATLIGCTGYVGGPGTQLKLLDAVFKAKVKRYFPWQFGVDYDVLGRGSGQDLFDEQLDVRDRLRAQSDVEWVIVSVGMFTSFVFEPFFGLVEGDLSESSKEDVVVRGLGSWDTKLTLTTSEDIGRMTAMILFEEPRIKNQIVYVAGDTISYAQFADIVGDRVEKQGRRVKRELWDFDKLREDLKARPDDVVAKYHLVFASKRGIAWKEDDRIFNLQKGEKLTGVAEYLSKRK
jgi:hypothetical protein